MTESKETKSDFLSEENPTHFIAQNIEKSLSDGLIKTLVTRFPPEPNGYLHIGHSKAIHLNFSLAETFNGKCNLRFDDTNPEKEDELYVNAIKEDINWLGYKWHGPVHFSSDYFNKLYDYAVFLIEKGLAYVCDLTPEEAREYRGTLTEPGRNSPYRERSIAENKSLFADMRAGVFPDGHCVLRAKIDMASGNMNMRDPIIYRIRRETHHQSGDEWIIYPTYDFTHGQSDALEGITHSICTLEFDDHRPLYDWFIEHLPEDWLPASVSTTRPHQYEFARLNINYTVTSKRKLKLLVDENIVDGWDDPRMPTIAGMRRRGFTPNSIRNFCDSVGVSRSLSTVDVGMLEHALRSDLDKNSSRAMAVLNPLKVIITNFNQEELLTAPGHPQRDDFATRELPWTQEIFIDKDDFRESANKKYKRLVLGKKVRLRNAYVIIAHDVVKNEQGEIIEVHCKYDADTLGKMPADGIKPKGVIQWVSATKSLKAKIRLYDRLFKVAKPGEESGNIIDDINPDSCQEMTAWVEPSLNNAVNEQIFQFEREGYFIADRYLHKPTTELVFNRAIALKDNWGD